jgi:RHS repeat-associated protein
VENTYDYRAFGRMLSASENVTNPYRFTGREFESGGILDIHYMRHRYYMAQLGIFASRDVIDADSFRGWGYAANNPVMFADPFGLEEEASRGFLDYFVSAWTWINSRPNGKNYYEWVDTGKLEDEVDTGNPMKHVGMRNETVEYDPDLARGNADKIQKALDNFGSTPVVGLPLDVANAAISYVRDDNSSAIKYLGWGIGSELVGLAVSGGGEGLAKRINQVGDAGGLVEESFRGAARWSRNGIF